MLKKDLEAALAASEAELQSIRAQADAAISSQGRKLALSAKLDQAAAYLAESGAPLMHNRDLIRAIMPEAGERDFDAIYSALKADPRFIFRPFNAPASFALAPPAEAPAEA